MEWKIRTVRPEDLDAVEALEAACFPPEEAAGRESLKMRIEAFSDSFLVAEKDGAIIGMVNGCVTDRETICDEMFADAGAHVPEGAWQAVFGLDVAPAHRSQGLAAALMREMIARARAEGRQGMILTCKAALTPYYERFGYRNKGISASVHGGAVWYDMVLKFGR
ncbi:MAG: GNAT family N-acetyltransferase [Oscillospiraceae bacterium]|nr:GNAT family N-acetyltransferase [Oscillospiraceae bacterium]